MQAGRKTNIEILKEGLLGQTHLAGNGSLKKMHRIWSIQT